MTAEQQVDSGIDRTHRGFTGSHAAHDRLHLEIVGHDDALETDLLSENALQHVGAECRRHQRVDRFEEDVRAHDRGDAGLHGGPEGWKLHPTQTLLFKGGVARKGSGGDASVRVQQLLAFAHSKKEPRVKSEGGDKKEFKKIPMEVLFAFHSDGTLRGFGRQKPGTKGSGSSSNPAVQAGATAGALVALSLALALAPLRLREVALGRAFPTLDMAALTSALDGVVARLPGEPGRTLWVGAAAQHLIVKGHAAVSVRTFQRLGPRVSQLQRQGDLGALYVFETPIDRDMEPAFGSPRELLQRYPSEVVERVGGKMPITVHRLGR